MNPVDFPEANRTFGPPPDMTESQVRPIQVFAGQVVGGSCDGQTVIIAAWKPTEQEIADIVAGKPVFLPVFGGLPPHYLCTSFEEAKNIA